MAHPSHQLGQTFKQHLILLGEAVGVLAMGSDGDVALPTNLYELNKLKRKFNQGIKKMTLARPQGWNLLRPIVPITISTNTTLPTCLDGDISKWRLPSYCAGRPLTNWNWADVLSNTSGEASVSTIEEVARKLAEPITTGWPRLVAVAPRYEQNADGTDRTSWYLRVWPRPQSDVVLSAMFKAIPSDMTELSERSPFGPVLDPCVTAAAKWAWVEDDSTDERRALWKQDYEEALQKAIDMDDSFDPSDLGPMVDTCEPSSHTRPMSNTATFNGVVIS
jgi:hypothetical protein